MDFGSALGMMKMGMILTVGTDRARKITIIKRNFVFHRFKEPVLTISNEDKPFTTDELLAMDWELTR
jgi:hypothetical protein